MTKRFFLWAMATTVALAILFGAEQAHASHFRSGTISWKVPDPVTAPLTVEFNVIASWRANFTNPDTDLEFGDGATNGDQVGTQVGAGVDAAGNPYKVMQYSATHTYAASGSYTAFFDACCRVVGLENGAGTNPNIGDYRVETAVDLTAGNTAGPSTASPAVIQLQFGAVRTYSFPVFDPDGDPITCRLATAAESGLTPPATAVPAVPNGGAMPTVTAANNECTLTWDVTNALAGQQYAVHIVMESVHSGTTSSTALDLIVEIVSPAPPVCVGSGQFAVPVGAGFSTVVTATDPEITTTALVLTATNNPATSTLIPPPAAMGMPSPFATTFSWTPTATDAGTTRVVLLSFTNDLNLTGTCALSLFVPECPSFGQACTAGVGACQSNGTIVCSGAADQCTAVAGTPQLETCNTIDDDCNGFVDDGNPGAGVTCTTGLLGVCAAGATSMCVAGNQTCDPSVQPSVEVCNGLDDDCDGMVDEDNPEGGDACDTTVPGVCAAGTQTCVAGALVCQQDLMSAAESCNGLDDDCNGQVDDGDPGGGGSCMTGLFGACSTGVETCSNAAIVCVPDAQPVAETCNSVDDDCNGTSDDVTGACETGLSGVCGAGAYVCQNGAKVCVQNVQATIEACNGLDDNCDGSVDEGDPGGGGTCVTGALGQCAVGTYQCVAEAVSCVPTTPSTAEICDNLDNDCDGVVDEDFDISECATVTIAVVCPNGEEASTEVCDFIDNDCDGEIDEGCDEKFRGSGLFSCTVTADQSNPSNAWSLWLLAAALMSFRRQSRKRQETPRREPAHQLP